MVKILNKKLSKKFLTFIKVISFFLIIYFFYKFIDNNSFASILSKVSFKNIFYIFILYLLIIILVTLRWHIIVRSFSKYKFQSLLENILSGFSINLIFSSGLTIDAVKFFKIKKEVGYKLSLILVSFDKLFSLIFKIIFFLIILSFYLFFNNNEYLSYTLFVLILSFVILIFIYFKISYLFIYFNKMFLKEKKKLNIIIYLIKNKKTILYLIIINLIIQLIITTTYFLIFLSIENIFTFIELLIYIPIIEILAQFSFILVGIKEVSTVFILSFFGAEKELALAGALFYLFIEYVVIIFLNLVFILKKILLKK